MLCGAGLAKLVDRWQDMKKREIDMTDPASGDQALLARDNQQTWHEMTYGGVLSFARRICRRACCTRRRSGPMLVACGGPHSYCVHVQTLVDIGMLQALVACSCRTCGVHAACDLSLKAGRGHGRGACGVRVERIVFATERGTGLLLRVVARTS